ncbi:MAG: hypothetical protein M3R63_09225 [Actinomycetota bacterium]|nr:hypothetical protein [Actinomycetota bacterium]
MPIDTLIDGDPESIRQAGRWLRSTLSTKVVDCVSDIHHARTEGEWAWGGGAGAGFHTRMTSGTHQGDILAADADTAGRDFEAHADNMVTALAGMGRARQIGRDGGLDVVDEQILEPGPAPSAPQALPTDGSATAAMVQSYDAGIQAQEVHAQRAAAYAAAADEAANARRVVDDSTTWLRNKTVQEFRAKKWVHAADFGVNVGVAGVVASRVQSLRNHGQFLLSQRDLHDTHYLRGGGARSTALAQHFFDEADEAFRRSASVAARFGGKVPVIGLGITAAGIGVDVSQGKPVGKAVISGAAGALAAAGTVALVGGPVGVAAGLGIVAGVGVGWLAEAGYDALPHGVQDGIENGVDAVGGAIGDTGSAIGSGAKRAWDAIF